MRKTQHDLEVVVGQNVKAAREALEWKQSELAERVGVARSTIAKLESGGAISVSIISSIANVFAVPPYLFMLRTIDFKRLANVATCQSIIEKYCASGQPIVSPDNVERIQEMSSSPLKGERRQAIYETNAVVAQIFGITNLPDNPSIEEARKSRTAGTGIATLRLPTYPIVNGLIANMITT